MPTTFGAGLGWKPGGRNSIQVSVHGRNPVTHTITAAFWGLRWWEAGIRSRSQSQDWKPGTLMGDTGILTLGSAPLRAAAQSSITNIPFLWLPRPPLVTIVLFSACVSSTSYVSEVTQCLSFCVWLTSLSIMFSRLNHVVTKDKISPF